MSLQGEPARAPLSPSDANMRHPDASTSRFFRSDRAAAASFMLGKRIGNSRSASPRDEIVIEKRSPSGVKTGTIRYSCITKRGMIITVIARQRLS